MTLSSSSPVTPSAPDVGDRAAVLFSVSGPEDGEDGVISVKTSGPWRSEQTFPLKACYLSISVMVKRRMISCVCVCVFNLYLGALR